MSTSAQRRSLSFGHTGSLSMQKASSMNMPRASRISMQSATSTTMEMRSNAGLDMPDDAFRALLEKVGEEHYREVQELKAKIQILISASPEIAATAASSELAVNGKSEAAASGPAARRSVDDHPIGKSEDAASNQAARSSANDDLMGKSEGKSEAAASVVSRGWESEDAPPDDDSVADEKGLVEEAMAFQSEDTNPSAVKPSNLKNKANKENRDKRHLSFDDITVSVEVEDGGCPSQEDEDAQHERTSVQSANFEGQLSINDQGSNSQSISRGNTSVTSASAELIEIHEVWEGEDPNMSKWSKRFTGIVRIKNLQPRTSGKTASAVFEAQRLRQPCFILCKHYLTCQFLPLHPSSQLKVSWDLIAILALVYDAIFIPMQSFDLDNSDSSVLGILDWIWVSFWSLDMPLNFIVAYYSVDGKVITSFFKIACRYIKGWFLLDLLIVGSDWVGIAMRFLGDGSASEGAGLARLGKLMRVMRTMRTLRLLRLMKLRRFMGYVAEVVESEWMSLILGTAINMIALVGVNHFIACLWFLLGSATSPYVTWVTKYDFLNAPWQDQYIASLHWSLTQFTAASTQVTATNPRERVFSVLVLLFAIVAFSSFLSGITSAMTRLRTINSHGFTQSILLNKFLRQNRISRDLTARVTRYIQLLQSHHEAYLDANKVEYLRLLSGPLNVELQWERFMPILKPHPFFQKSKYLGQSAMQHLCYTAISSNFLAREDVMFDWGASSDKMYFAQSGWLFYRRPPGFKHTPRYAVLTRGQWFCENPLWTPWLHHGLMKTLIEVSLVVLHADKFHGMVCAHPEVFSLGRRYAILFVDVMNNPDQGRPYTWDVPWEVMYPDSQARDSVIDPGRIHVVCEEVIEVFEREAALVDMEYSRHESIRESEPIASWMGSQVTNRSSAN